MNNIKDIVKKDSLSINTESIFSVQNKFEKITLAVYMVTEIFPKEEPLRYRLRDRCVSLMSFIMSFNDSEQGFSKIKLLSSEIYSLLKISASSRLISEMNYSILINEYEKFLEILASMEESKTISKNLFQEEYIDSFNQIYKRHYKGQKDIKDKNISDSENVKDSQDYKRTLASNKKKNLPGFDSQKNERQDKILKIIKDKGEVTIKDISQDIKDCSSKTIQRELINMVDRGVLKKEGERRWSKYSLV